MPKTITVTVDVNESLAESLDFLKRGMGKWSPIRDESSRRLWMRILLMEAIYAAHDFGEARGYVPWQPRFDIDPTPGRDKTGRPTRDCACRWHDRLDRIRAIDEVLAAATKAADSGETAAPPPSPASHTPPPAANDDDDEAETVGA